MGAILFPPSSRPPEFIMNLHSGADGAHGDRVHRRHPEEHLPGAAGLCAAAAQGPPQKVHQEQEGPHQKVRKNVGDYSQTTLVISDFTQPRAHLFGHPCKWAL